MTSQTVKIHVIDDNEVARSYLKLLIGRISSKIEVLLFERAEDALKEIAENRLPNLVFCDLNMPKMDGAEYLVKLNQMLAINKVPLLPVIIVTSASGVSSDQNFSQIYENCAVFIKPLLFNQVSDLLNQFGLSPTIKGLGGN